MSKPTILLVPGAWHGPDSFSPLTTYLRQHDYTVEGISLASVGPFPASPHQGKSLPTFDDDVAIIRTTIEKHADLDSEIVLLFHSYSGIPGSSACQGLLKVDRQASGKPGGVVHLIYCCAFAVDSGVSLMDCLNGEPLSWLDFSDDGQSLMPKSPVGIFYNDIHDQAVLDHLVLQLQPQSYAAFCGKSTYAAWRHVNSTYIVCEEDQALAVPVQEAMLAHVNEVLKDSGAAVTMDQVRIRAGHSPFVSRPEDVGLVIRKIARR